MINSSSHSVILKDKYEKKYPEFTLKKMYSFNKVRLSDIQEIFIIEHKKYYPLEIFNIIYVNNN